MARDVDMIYYTMDRNSSNLLSIYDGDEDFSITIEDGESVIPVRIPKSHAKSLISALVRHL